MHVVVKSIGQVVLLLAVLVPAADTGQPQSSIPGRGGDEDRGDTFGELEAHLNSIVDASGEDPTHNAVLLVEGPNLRWKGAAGMADGQDEAMSADHKFKIASIAKTMTATVVLQLAEEGRLSLDDTLEEFFESSVVDLDTLHIHKGTSYGRRITVGQLLSHTSGIRDYMEDPRFRVVRRVHELETGMYVWKCEAPGEKFVRKLLRRLRDDVPDFAILDRAPEGEGPFRMIIDLPESNPGSDRDTGIKKQGH